MPLQGRDRTIAGVFASDLDGNTYLTHSGKIGGGRKGIGKKAFLNYYGNDQIAALLWHDKETEAIVIGRLDDEALPMQVADFVKRVATFKSRAVNSSDGETSPGSGAHAFAPEFQGERSGYLPAEIIRARCNHGRVVSGLHEAIEARGLNCANDRRRDLFVFTDNGDMTLLFEIKTDVSTSSIYEAIGQLMYHGAVQELVPKRIMVVPEGPKADAHSTLTKLGISVVVYRWVSEKPVFAGLQKLLSSCAV